MTCHAASLSSDKLDGQKYNQDLKVMLDRREDNVAPVAEMGEISSTDVTPSQDSDGKRRRPKLEELTRFTMVKRIW